MSGEKFAVVADKLSIAAQVGLFALNVPAGTRVKVKELRIGGSGTTDSVINTYPVHIVRHQTSATATAGGTVAPVKNLHPSLRATTVGASTLPTLATAGGAMVFSDVWVTTQPFVYQPREGDEPWAVGSNGLVVVVTATDTTLVNATLVFEETTGVR